MRAIAYKIGRVLLNLSPLLVALVLVGCSEQDKAEAAAAAAAAGASGNPLLIGLGAIASIIVSHVNTKSQVAKKDGEDWSDDDVAAMIRGIEAHGYTITKKP